MTTEAKRAACRRYYHRKRKEQIEAEILKPRKPGVSGIPEYRIDTIMSVPAEPELKLVTAIYARSLIDCLHGDESPSWVEHLEELFEMPRGFTRHMLARHKITAV